MERKDVKIVFLLLTTLAFSDNFDQFLGVQPVRSAIFQACAETGIPIHIAAGLQVSEWHEGEKDLGTCHGWWQLDSRFHAYYRDKFNHGVEFSEYDAVASTFVAIRYLAFIYKMKGTFVGALEGYKIGPYAKRAPSEAIVKLCRQISQGLEVE